MPEKMLAKVIVIPRRMSRQLYLAALVVMAVCGTLAYPTLSQLGLITNKAGVEPGYVIFGAPDGRGYAIDVKGQVANKWNAPSAGEELGYVRPLANGNLLAATHAKRGGDRPDAWPAGGDAIIEMTQDGREVWRYTSEANVSLHHDMERMDSGDTMMVCSRDLDRPAISKRLLTDDCLLEADASGKAVWDWQTADHLDELELPAQAKADILAGKGTTRPGAQDAKGFDYLHMNAASPIPASAGHTDPRFRAGNFIVSYRNISTIAVVDHASKKIVWKMTGTSIGQHNPHFIPSGVPGTGHILLFDNGFVDPESNPIHVSSRMNSRVLEINPLDNSIVWDYGATKSNRPIWTFFSHFISSAQRQPNGNTLICEGANGRIFEVKPDGEIVWEFVNPFANTSGKIPATTVFRAAKVSPDWLKVGAH